IYAAGNFTDYNGTGTNDLARLHPDGSFDSGFDAGAGFVGTVDFITPAIDGFGDLYVGGQFLDYNGMAIGSIARLNLVGALDTNFDTGTGFNDATSSVALATDGSGDVYVGGWFTLYKSSPVARMVRLTAGGAFVR
ncbi:delta-60 repeat domain-containing protein, partial [Draconibacterium sp.]|nr:delta-60 repeat domain-containing protein [Draconibacterium sp.]